MRVTVVLMTLASLIPASAGGQVEVSVPSSRLERFDHRFSALAGLRELIGGAILASDAIEASILRIDAPEAEAIVIGHNGEGPREYVQPGPMAGRGDTTFVTDQRLSRLAVVESGSRIAGTLRYRGDAESMLGVPPRGVDELGRLILRERDGGDISFGQVQQRPTEARLVAYDVAHHRASTITSIFAPLVPPKALLTGQPASSLILFTPAPVPFPAEDAYAVGSDGTIAVARVRGRPRIEWMNSSGDVLASNSLELPSREVTQRDRREFLEQWKAEQRRDGHGADETIDNLDVDDVEWPDVLPPFAPDHAHVGGGHFWLRSYERSDGSLYYVMDRNGDHVATVSFPEGHSVVGVSDSYVYLITYDEVGLGVLSRVPTDGLL